jgi:hypothetical protein
MWLDKAINIFGGNFLDGVKDLIQTFKLPPEQQLAFDQRLAELQAETEMKLAALDASDRDSARKREMEVKDHTPKVLAYGITSGFFGVLFYILNFDIPNESENVVYVMLGSLGTAWTGIMAYYYGSSAGSAAKHTLLDKLTTERVKA